VQTSEPARVRVLRARIARLRNASRPFPRSLLVNSSKPVTPSINPRPRFARRYEKKRVLLCEKALGSFEEVFKGEEEGETEEESEEEADLIVMDEGGSSGRLTTMVTKELEWSATGRHGASLVDLAKADFSRTAFGRCQSRLGEMMRADWLDKAVIDEELRREIRSLVV